MPQRVKTPEESIEETTIDDRYKVVREIGQGAAGTVYEGVQLSVDRRVAIKILSQANQSREDYRERFTREARAIARLSHTNCITLHDFGYSDEYEALYMVMEFVDGVELFELIKDEPLPFRRALNITIQIAEAIAHAHKHGILHRDLKPENVLVTPDDEVKVLDFGLARMLDLFADEKGRRLTAEGAIFGTPAYMSPEQCSGDLDVTVHSDIYSLGIVMYQLFEGRLPFDSKQVVKVLTQHAKSPPPAITAPIPKLLKNLIGQMLEKEKAKRPSTATVVADSLRAVLLGLAVDDGELMPDVSQEIQRSILSRELPAVKKEQVRHTTENGGPNLKVHPPSGRARPAQPQGGGPRPAAQRASPRAARLKTQELIGHRLGKYEVIAILGEGAMSTVFAARDDSGEDVAIKIAGRKLPEELRASERFEREIELLERLDHPNIISLRDHGYDAHFDRVYLVMDLVRGDDLETLCAEGRASMELALIVGHNVASALEHAHGAGVTHRDLKPSNLMVCPRDDGTVTTMVLDFGLARLIDDGTRLTAAGDAPGTLSYMAPELLRGAEASPRSDIYSFGTILYEMLSGHPPFEGKTRKDMAMRVQRGLAPPLHEFVHEVPKALSQLIARMMSKDPSGRPASASEVLQELEGLLGQLTLRPFRVKHRGPSSNPMSDWQLRRRVSRPVQRRGGAAPRTSRPAPASRSVERPADRTPVQDVAVTWKPSRARSWVILSVAAVVIGGVAFAVFGLGLGVRDVVNDPADANRAPVADHNATPSSAANVAAPEPEPAAEPNPAAGETTGATAEQKEPRKLDDLEFIP